MVTPASGSSEPVDVYRVNRAKCFDFGCPFEFRGETAELEADAHSRQTEHPLIRVHYEGDRWFVRPRPPQRALCDLALAARTVDEVRAIFRDAGEHQVLDTEVHGLFGTKTLRLLLADRAQQLTTRPEPT